MKEHQSQRLYGNGGSRMPLDQEAKLLSSPFSKNLKTWTHVRAALLLSKRKVSEFNLFVSLSKGIATEHRDERTRLGTVHPRHRRGDSRKRDFNIKVFGLRYQTNTRDNPRFRGYQPYNLESDLIYTCHYDRNDGCKTSI